MKRPRRSAPLAIPAAAVVVVLAGNAAGQLDEPVRPPKVEQPAKAPTWLYYVVGAGAIAIGVGLAVFPSRRTHED